MPPATSTADGHETQSNPWPASETQISSAETPAEISTAPR